MMLFINTVIMYCMMIQFSCHSFFVIFAIISISYKHCANTRVPGIILDCYKTNINRKIMNYIVKKFFKQNNNYVRNNDCFIIISSLNIFFKNYTPSFICLFSIIALPSQLSQYLIPFVNFL